MYFQFFFMFWLAIASDGSSFSHRPSTLNQTPAKVSQPVAAQENDDSVPYGPEPMCGGSKDAGDRWCY